MSNHSSAARLNWMATRVRYEAEAPELQPFGQFNLQDDGSGLLIDMQARLIELRWPPVGKALFESLLAAEVVAHPAPAAADRWMTENGGPKREWNDDDEVRHDMKRGKA